MKYLVCEVCGKVVEVVKDTNVPTMCCGQAMKALEPGTTDAAVEKHVPAVKVCDTKVCVTIGEVEHPMVEAHYIEWIALETKMGCQKKVLKAGESPKAEFVLAECDEAIAVYAYCNLHGLWKKEM